MCKIVCKIVPGNPQSWWFLSMVWTCFNRRSSLEAMNFCLAQARLAVPLAVAGAFHTDFMVGRAGDVETPSRYHDWDWWFGPFWTILDQYVLWLSRWLGIFYPNWLLYFSEGLKPPTRSDWQLHSEFDVISRLFKTFQANLQLGENQDYKKNIYIKPRDSSRQSCLKFHSYGGVPFCVPPNHPVDDRMTQAPAVEKLEEVLASETLRGRYLEPPNSPISKNEATWRV